MILRRERRKKSRAACLQDKGDAFCFVAVKFCFISSNISLGPTYCVYALQVIHYGRCCSDDSDFR